LSDGKKRIRVNPELVNIENSTQMWSKPYEAEFSSAFTLQSEIAATVAEALNLKLVKSEQKSLESNITNNSAAYDTYLKARYYSQDIHSEKNSRIAVELLENAIKLDSSFAAAYAALSTVQSNMYWSYFEHTDENLEQAKANAQKALLINSDLAEAHVAMGDYYYHGILDYESALHEYEKAISLNPNLVDSYNGIAFVLRRQGKMRKTIEYLEKTFELDPRDYITVLSIGETYNLLREYEKSIPYFDKANLLAPEAIPPYETKARSYLLAVGDTQKARSIIQNARERKIGLDSYLFSVSLYYCDILDRDFNAALKQIKGVKETDDQYYYKPEDLYLAEAYRFLKNSTLAEKHFLAAKKLLEEKIKQNPQDSRLYTSRGIACAGLGEKETAIREGKHGYELLPISREAWRGSFRLLDLAKIYTMVGEPDLAIQALDELLSRPTDAISIALLKIDPTWDALRENPKFQEILQNYSKEII
jgi:tetratricopeptide (TPR) repeat protein